MMSLFGPKTLDKATTSCCLQGSGEEILCLENLQLQPRHPPIIPASETKLEQRSLSAQPPGDSRDV